MRVNGRSNYKYPGQRWVPKLVYIHIYILGTLGSQASIYKIYICWLIIQSWQEQELLIKPDPAFKQQVFHILHKQQNTR